MNLLCQRRMKACHRYSRESVTAIPRIRASGRVQAWRAGDGEIARPIYPARAAAGISVLDRDLPLAA